MHWHTTAHPDLAPVGQVVFIADKLDQGPIQRLLWFSRGYYHVERRADGLDEDLVYSLHQEWITAPWGDPVEVAQHG